MTRYRYLGLSFDQRWRRIERQRIGDVTLYWLGRLVFMVVHHG